MQKSRIARIYRGGGYFNLRNYKGLCPFGIAAVLIF